MDKLFEEAQRRHNTLKIGQACVDHPPEGELILYARGKWNTEDKFLEIHPIQIAIVLGTDFDKSNN